MKTDDEALVERVARAIYGSRLLVQPREPWGAHMPTRSVTEKFCIEAARAALEALPAPDEAVPASGGVEAAFRAGLEAAAQYIEDCGDYGYQMTASNIREIMTPAALASSTPAESAGGGVVARWTSAELLEIADICESRRDFCHRNVYSEGMSISEAALLEEQALGPAASALRDFAAMLAPSPSPDTGEGAIRAGERSASEIAEIDAAIRARGL